MTERSSENERPAVEALRPRGGAPGCRDDEARTFLLEEYKALRTEILAKVDRAMRIQILGLTAIPFVIGIGEKQNFEFLLAASPIVTILFALLVLYENEGVMRAGCYIRDRLEPELLKTTTLGWENWLEDHPGHRKPDRYFALATYTAFTLYFLGGAYRALVTFKPHPPTAVAVGSIYLVSFVVALVWVVRSLATGTEAVHPRVQPELAGSAAPAPSVP